MTLNEQEKVWKFSTMLPINDEYCLMIYINYFEEVVGFEVVLNLPNYLDNEIFKHKVNSRVSLQCLINIQLEYLC